MATNFHSDLPNDQIHAPKDFSVASNSSVLVKSDSGDLQWEASLFNLSTTVICGADVAGVLHNSFFHIFFSKTLSIEAHFSVTGDATAFVPTTGFTQAAITIAANDTAIQVADAIKVELDRLASSAVAAFVTTVNGSGQCTFSGMQNTNDTVDMGTGFVYGNTRTPYGNQSLVSNVGVLSWEEKTDPAVTSLTTTGTSGVSTLSAGVLNVPNYTSLPVSYLSQNIEGFGDIELGSEYGMSNAQYNAEHKFTVNLGTSPVSDISPKFMLYSSIWSSPMSGTQLSGWNGWISGTGTVVLSLLRATLTCPIVGAYPSTIPVCRVAQETVTLLGNNSPICFNHSSFLTCEGFAQDFDVNETLILSAYCTSETASFNINFNILFKI